MFLSGSIDLTLLAGAQVQTATDGTQAIIIPIRANDLFYSSKGHVYLSINVFERKAPSQYGATHDIKQSYSKEKRESLPQGTYPPTLGNMKVVMTQNDRSGQGGIPQNNYPTYQQQMPQGYTPINAQPAAPMAQPTPAPSFTPQPAPAATPQNTAPTNDLPF
jgi:hypothetical protein